MDPQDIEGDPTLTPEKMDEVKKLLSKMQSGFADMSEEDKEEFRKGFVDKLAQKVRNAAASEGGQAVQSQGMGVFITAGAFLVFFTLFALASYKVYQFIQEQGARENAKGRTKSLKPSKRKEKRGD